MHGDNSVKSKRNMRRLRDRNLERGRIDITFFEGSDEVQYAVGRKAYISRKERPGGKYYWLIAGRIISSAAQYL